MTEPNANINTIVLNIDTVLGKSRQAGFTRSGPDRWHVDCRPEHLIAQAHKSRRQLGVEQIGLWQ